MNVLTKRVLLVSDTTSSVNWGGRSASPALQQHLAQQFKNIELLPCRFSRTPRAIQTVLPSSLANALFLRRLRYGLLKIYCHYEEIFGAKDDFIELDPSKSAENILRNRNTRYIRNLFEAVSSADVVVVDGNGDLIFRTPPGRIPLFNLAVIELASRLGKEIYYVNSIFSDCPMTGRNLEFLQYAVSSLSKCRAVVFRDASSLELARSVAPQLKTQLIPDSLFLWHSLVRDAAAKAPEHGGLVIPNSHHAAASNSSLQIDRPYACISGSSHAAFYQEEAVEAYSRLAVAVQARLGMNVYLVPTCRGDRFLSEVAERTALPIIPVEIPVITGAAILAGAQVYITGRYHPAILASHGGTPCVFLGADSHKTSSLQQLLQYERLQTFSPLPSAEEAEQIASLALERLREGAALRQRVRDAARDCAQEASKLGELIAGTRVSNRAAVEENLAEV
ncbi:MAG: polysaccharide pyruvyl transferase family protein [Terracidiphilus sp.]